MAHAVFDSDTLKAQAAMAEYEAKKQLELDWFCRKMEDERIADALNMSDIEHQQGHQLSAKEFERRVKKIAPSALFVTRPIVNHVILNQTTGNMIKSLDQLLPDGTVKLIVGYQNHPMLPEFHIRLVKKTKIPNMTVQSVDASEFPKSRLEGNKWVFAGPTPFEKEIQETVGHLVGWRTILARAVKEGLTTITAVEKEFGSCDRLGWAVEMGKRNEIYRVV